MCGSIQKIAGYTNQTLLINRLATDRSCSVSVGAKQIVAIALDAPQRRAWLAVDVSVNAAGVLVLPPAVVAYALGSWTITETLRVLSCTLNTYKSTRTLCLAGTDASPAGAPSGMLGFASLELHAGTLNAYSRVAGDEMASTFVPPNIVLVSPRRFVLGSSSTLAGDVIRVQTQTTRAFQSSVISVEGRGSVSDGGPGFGRYRHDGSWSDPPFYIGGTGAGHAGYGGRSWRMNNYYYPCCVDWRSRDYFSDTVSSGSYSPMGTPDIGVGQPYGSVSQPTQMGSGGGLGYGSNGGGSGGGVVRLTATEDAVLSGALRAWAGGGYQGYYGGAAGGGSGGSVLIEARGVYGYMSINADGGQGSTQQWDYGYTCYWGSCQYGSYHQARGGGGSGGRIALVTSLGVSWNMTYSVLGRNNNQNDDRLRGDDGTVRTALNACFNGGSLVTLAMPVPYELGASRMGNSACVCPTSYYGPQCAVFCSPAVTCGGRGTCDGSGHCVCSTGFSGQFCEQGCSRAATCGNRGSCVVRV